MCEAGLVYDVVQILWVEQVICLERVDSVGKIICAFADRDSKVIEFTSTKEKEKMIMNKGEKREV